MMSRRFGLLLLGALVAVAWPLTAGAQPYPSEKLSFEDVAGQPEIFQSPTFSPSTRGLDPTKVHTALRSSDWGGSEGPQAMGITLYWEDGADPYGWVRLTSFNGPVRPNPALHTQGKVRFKVCNRGNLTGTGAVGLCVAVRETGALVPQMFDGSGTGSIEMVGVSLVPSVIECGTDDCQSGTTPGTPDGDDILVEWTPEGGVDTYKAISWGPDRTLQTVAVTGDEQRNGYTRATDGGLIPIPVVDVPIDFFNWVPFEVNLANGAVTFGGVTYPGGIVSMTTGVAGTLADAPDQRGTLESLIITNSPTDTETTIAVFIDELQFEAPAFDPILAPAVQSPIIQTDTTVTVTNLVPYVNRVKLFKNGSEVGNQPLSPATPGAIKTYTFNVPEHATGDTYTAEQWDSKTPVNQQSDLSAPVGGLSGPPPYSFSILLDESGNGSCGPYVDPWEWVGVTAPVSGYAPLGTGMVPKSGEWQYVDIPLTDPNVVEPSPFGGGTNGSLAPSPTGNYTMDSLWFTISPEADSSGLGPWELFIDGVQLVDLNDQVTTAIFSMEDGVNRLPSARGQSPVQSPNFSTGLSSLASYDGSNSHRLTVTYSFDPSRRALGILQRVGTGCGTSTLIPDTTKSIRFHLLCRDARVNPDIALPEIVAPVVGEQTWVRVNCDVTATAVQLYVNGLPEGSPADPGGAAYVDFTGLSLSENDSVSAKQTLPAGESDLAYPRAAAKPLPPTVQAPILVNATSVTLTNVQNVLLDAQPYAVASTVQVYADTGSGPVLVGSAAAGTDTVVVTTSALAADTKVTATQTVNGLESLPSAPVIVGQPPAPPKVMVPLQAGDATVNLTNVNTAATLVTVYAGDTPIGSINPAGATSVAVPVTPLVHLDAITATASNPSGEGVRSTPAKEVGKGNGDLFICIGIREIATNPALGADGGTSGGIEWVGSSTTSGAPAGIVLNPSAGWQTITIDPAVGPIRNFSGGNGVLSSTYNKGTLEHIAFTVNSTSANRSVGSYVIYIDNVVNVGAGAGGADFLISNFDSFAVGATVMFRQPSFSGSTSANLEATTEFPAVPNSTLASADQSNPAGGKSVKTSWYFKDTAATRWLRLTSYAATNLPNPTIDLTKPVRFDVLVLPVLPPDAPTVNGPLQQGDKAVLITNIAAESTLVQVFAGTNLIGSINPAGADTVVVPVSTLVHLDSITAKQSGPSGVSGTSNAIEVGKGNGNILLTLGIRDSGDIGALGTEGGTTGGIEWIGASAATGGAPQGKPISPLATWQTVTFDPTTDPILNFYLGDGVITESRGSIEHLAVAVDSASASRSTGPYKLYVDNVVNVGAGDGGADFVITNFETHLGTPLVVGTEALFNEPRYSGTTDVNLLATPNISLVSDARGNPSQSERLSWFWVDTTAGRWVRLTTSGAQNVSRPIIDLTKPIRMDVLLLPACETVPGDMSGNGSVNGEDIVPFITCVGGPTVAADPSCVCGDFNNDDYVDVLDFAEFQAAFAE